MDSIFDRFMQQGKDRSSDGKVTYLNSLETQTDQVKISATVKGKVQGVGFRFSTKQAADEIGIGGIVRNEADGTVYVEANGSPDAIDSFIERLRLGPSPSAIVDEVVVKYEENLKDRDKFSQAN